MATVLLTGAGPNKSRRKQELEKSKEKKINPNVCLEEGPSGGQA
jgi:hypothetical protein